MKLLSLILLFAATALAVPLEDQLLVSIRPLTKAFPSDQSLISGKPPRKNETAFVCTRLPPQPPTVQSTKDGDQACPKYCAGGSQYINCGASYVSPIQALSALNDVYQAEVLYQDEVWTNIGHFDTVLLRPI